MKVFADIAGSAIASVGLGTDFIPTRSNAALVLPGRNFRGYGRLGAFSSVLLHRWLRKVSRRQQKDAPARQGSAAYRQIASVAGAPGDGEDGPERKSSSAADHSALMAALMIGHHFSISALWKVRSASGDCSSCG